MAATRGNFLCIPNARIIVRLKMFPIGRMITLHDQKAQKRKLNL